MLVIGGWFPDPTHTDCDAPKAQGQHNMVLGNNTERKFIWDDFDPGLSTYVVPPVVIAAIGGGYALSCSLETGENGTDDL